MTPMTLQQETLRETLQDENGQVTVIVNLSFPTLHKKKDKSALCKPFCDFYRKAAEGFRAFAGSELHRKAQSNPPGTPPCGAVLRYRHKETEDAFIITLSGSVFDGFTAHPIREDVRVWEKKTGLLR